MGAGEERVAMRERRDMRVRGMDRRGGGDLASSISCIIRLGAVFDLVSMLLVIGCAVGNDDRDGGVRWREK